MSKKEKNFPLLRPYPEPEDFEKVKKSDPLFLGEIRRLENFTEMVLSGKHKQERIGAVIQTLRDIFKATGKNKEIYFSLNQALAEAQNLVRYLISETPVSLRGVVESEGQVAEEKDFITLLEKRKKYLIERKEALSKIREFEARRLIVFSLIFFDLKLHAQKLHLNGTSSQAITVYLEKKFFEKGEAERKAIFAFHDSNDEFRVKLLCFENEPLKDLEINEEWIMKKYEMVCRKFLWQEKSYLVYFSCRDKTPHSHLLKMLRKDIRDPRSSALDWRGFKLVFFNEESLEAGLNKLRYKVFYLPGMTWKLTDGEFFRESLTSFSSKNFRAKKFVTTVGGEPVEVIIETITNHLNGIASCGEENHELYRLRQLLKSGLPLVFPFEVYNINWEEREEEIVKIYKRSLQV